MEAAVVADVSELGLETGLASERGRGEEVGGLLGEGGELVDIGGNHHLVDDGADVLVQGSREVSVSDTGLYERSERRETDRRRRGWKEVVERGGAIGNKENRTVSCRPSNNDARTAPRGEAKEHLRKRQQQGWWRPFVLLMRVEKDQRTGWQLKGTDVSTQLRAPRDPSTAANPARDCPESLLQCRLNKICAGAGGGRLTLARCDVGCVMRVAGQFCHAVL